MKKIILITILLLSGICYSQKDSLRWLRYGAYFTAGIAEGYSDVLQFHYNKFQNIHPNANPQYWNPQISWTNKYKSKVPFAKTAMVFTTDGWHLSKFIKNVGIFGGICIPIQKGKKWWLYLKKGAICYGINRIGFNLIYNGIYK